MGDIKEEEDLQKPAKEILSVQDTGFFTHITGDTYDGGFEIKKKEKIARMNKHGVYKTREGDSYQGNWSNDKLGAGEIAKISYVDGSEYTGYIKDWSYSGSGKYVYPDNSKIECEFHDNSPVGTLTLTDPNGHVWQGSAEQGFAWFHPVNHFYDMLERPKELIKQKSSRDSGKSKGVPHTLSRRKLQ